MIRNILSIFGLVAAIGIFIFYTQPTYDDVKSVRTEIGGYDDALSRAAELQARKQTLLSKYNAMDPKNVERLEKLLPDHVDNVRLVLNLDSLASRHGLALENVVIGTPSSQAQSQTVVGAIGAGRQKYDSLTLKFSTSGTYTDFVRFLGDLESDLRVVDVVSLALERGGSASLRRPFSDPSASPEAVFRFDISIRTYWLK